MTAIGVTSSQWNLTLIPNGTFSYVHDGSETTTDTFSYKANDGTDDGNTVTITITINPINDTPIAIGDILMGVYSTTVTLTTVGSSTLMDNDYDPEGTSITANTTLSSNPTYGSAVVNANGTFSSQMVPLHLLRIASPTQSLTVQLQFACYCNYYIYLISWGSGSDHSK